MTYAHILGGAPTNQQRAAWAQKAVSAFHEAVGDLSDNEPLEEVVRDITADLMHLMFLKGHSKSKIFEAVYEGASCFDEEISLGPSKNKSKKAG